MSLQLLTGQYLSKWRILTDTKRLANLSVAMQPYESSCDGNGEHLPRKTFKNVFKNLKKKFFIDTNTTALLAGWCYRYLHLQWPINEHLKSKKEMRETPFKHVRRIDTAQTAHQGALYKLPHGETCLKCHKNNNNWAEVGKVSDNLWTVHVSLNK